MTENSKDVAADIAALLRARRLYATGSAWRCKPSPGQQLAGRSVDRQAVAQGHHSHDNGGDLAHTQRIAP